MATNSHQENGLDERQQRESNDFDWNKKYMIGYRHSGETETDLWKDIAISSISFQEVLDHLGDNQITQIRCENDIPPLSVVAPNLKTLAIANLTEPNQLESISTLVHLEELSISCSNFSDGLPEAVDSLANLKRLHLSRCHLTDLPESLSNLTQLKEMDLTGNEFTDGFPEVLDKLTGLEKLKVSECEIESLPNRLSNLCRLKDLDLSGNDLFMCSLEVLGSLTSLEKLRLSDCCLPDLPESLSNLTQLKELSLSGNDFTDRLPEVLGNLTNLKKLDVSGCKIISLPNCLSNLSRLKDLDLSGNDLSMCSSEVLGSLTSLERLSLSDCCLPDLPESLSNLSLLKDLNLSCHDLPMDGLEVLGSLTSLEKLSLFQCCLPDLPESLSNLTQLKELDLTGNEFTDGFPEVLDKLTGLEKLKVSECEIESLPDCLSNLSLLKDLDLSGNDLSKCSSEVLGSLTSLEKLSLSDCCLPDLPESLSNLSQLKEIDVSQNHFAGSLPEVLACLTNLEKLSSADCEITCLPERLKQLTKLEMLDCSGNHLTEVPSWIAEMKSLQTLTLQNNLQLTTITDMIVSLPSLIKLDCSSCPALKSPPYGICVQGLGAVKSYYKDLNTQEGVELRIVPVSIVGESMAGKTSLIDSLQEERRVLTDRSEANVLDETTKVFNVHSLKLDNSIAKMIDHGGNQVYHIAYPYILKERNVPMLVVNMRKFRDLALDKGEKFATEELCWKWLAHLYLACPLLKSPLLVLTHADCLTSDELRDYQSSLFSHSTALRNESLHTEELKSRAKSQVLQEIVFFSDRNAGVFRERDTFVFGNESHQIDSLRKAIDERCKEFTAVLPKQWSDVQNFLMSSDEPFVSLAEFQLKWPDKKSLQMLRYMHNIGAVLWFENIYFLKDHIFVNMQKLTDMISVLFHHSDENLWKRRLAEFKEFDYQERPVGKAQYQQFVDEFRESGILDEALLRNLLQTETAFSFDVAIELLKKFWIVHGPIHRVHRLAYAIPYFARKKIGPLSQKSERIKLLLNIEMRGLPMPKYGFQLVTTAVLNELLNEFNEFEIASDGVTVYDEEFVTQLLHDVANRKIALQVSSEAINLDFQWKQLQSLARCILNLLSTTWKASLQTIRIYCGHCLFLNEPEPSSKVDPGWFLSQSGDAKVEECSGVRRVTCPKQAEKTKSKKPCIPAALVRPCTTLSEESKSQISSYLDSIKPVCPTPAETQEQVTGTLVQREESDSELSDTMEDLQQISDRLEVRPCTRSHVRDLFHSDEVYQMTLERGRCFVINNIDFTYSDGSSDRREGSTLDGQRIVTLFRNLGFICSERTNISSQNMLEVIREETGRPEHINYGMFVLIIMSHGSETGLSGTDGGIVSRESIYQALSAQQFRAMKRKPKLVIFQACSGRQRDSVTDATPSLPSPSQTPVLPSSGSSPMTTLTSTGSVTAPQGVPQSASLPSLDSDDFLIWHASFPGNVAYRNPGYGTCFINAIIESLSKHACHRDLKTLFDNQIREKVRKRSIDTREGQQPLMGSTLHKRLCLFPGYNP